MHKECAFSESPPQKHSFKNPLSLRDFEKMLRIYGRNTLYSVPKMRKIRKYVVTTMAFFSS